MISLRGFWGGVLLKALLFLCLSVFCVSKHCNIFWKMMTPIIPILVTGFVLLFSKFSKLSFSAKTSRWMWAMSVKAELSWLWPPGAVWFQNNPKNTTVTYIHAAFPAARYYGVHCSFQLTKTSFHNNNKIELPLKIEIEENQMGRQLLLRVPL